MPPAFDVAVHVDEGLAVPVDTAAVEAAVLHVLRAEGAPSAEISVAFLNDPGIATLNREYLHHEGPTDVISFPLDVPEGAGVLGDIYVGAEQAARQAAEHGVSVAEELIRLAIHGVLHVLGYEHPNGDERDASPMYRRQEELLAAILRERHG